MFSRLVFAVGLLWMAPIQVVAQGVAHGVAEAMAQVTESFSADDFRNLPDPTRPPDFNAPVPTAQDGPLPNLSSVLYSAERRRAVIDGQVVGEGDQVAGFVVRRIAPGEVFLQLADNQIVSLTLATPARVTKRRLDSQWVQN
ncbi:MAG: hypothetical protein AAF993_03685 [Pseudomonadota bacterium]